MKQILKLSLGIFLLGILLVSCKQEGSIQSYFVEKGEQSNFLMGNISPSLIKLGDLATLSDKQQKAQESIKGLNYLLYRIKDSTGLDYENEIAQVSSLLNHEKFNDLMDFKVDGLGKISLKYIGDDEVVDEFIVFGKNPELGFGVIRVVGNEMKLEELMTLGDVFKEDNFNDNSQFKDIINFLK